MQNVSNGVHQFNRQRSKENVQDILFVQYNTVMLYNYVLVTASLIEKQTNSFGIRQYHKTQKEHNSSHRTDKWSTGHIK